MTTRRVLHAVLFLLSLCFDAGAMFTQSATPLNFSAMSQLDGQSEAQRVDAVSRSVSPDTLTPAKIDAWTVNLDTSLRMGDSKPSTRTGAAPSQSSAWLRLDPRAAKKATNAALFGA